MRANGDLRLAGSDPGERPLLLSCRERPVQPGNANAERFEPFAELSRVLLGEDLSRRHHGGLVIGVRCGEAGDGGNDGLAAADIALQQALHRMRLHQISQHLVHRARLRAGQLEWQCEREGLEERAVGAQPRRRAAAPLAVGELERELLRQQLVELHAPPRRMRALAEQSAADLAEGPHVQALLYGLFELIELRVAEVEEAQHQSFGVHDELPLTTEKDRRALYARLHQYWVSGRGRVKRSKDCLVLVAQRQMQDEVERGSQSQLVELRGFHPACRVASISTSAPRGSPATPTAARD